MPSRSLLLVILHGTAVIPERRIKEIPMITNILHQP